MYLDVSDQFDSIFPKAKNEPRKNSESFMDYHSF